MTRPWEEPWWWLPGPDQRYPRGTVDFTNRLRAALNLDPLNAAESPRHRYWASAWPVGTVGDWDDAEDGKIYPWEIRERTKRGIGLE